MTHKVVNLLFSDDGRLARGPYWLFGVLLPMLALLAILFLCNAVTHLDLRDRPALGGLVQMLNAVFGSVAICVWLWIFIVTTMKRLHDRGMSGWWFWIGLVPMIGWLILAIICLGAGDEGPNRYGPA